MILRIKDIDPKKSYTFTHISGKIKTYNGLQMKAYMCAMRGQVEIEIDNKITENKIKENGRNL